MSGLINFRVQRGRRTRTEGPAITFNRHGMLSVISRARRIFQVAKTPEKRPVLVSGINRIYSLRGII